MYARNLHMIELVRDYADTSLFFHIVLELSRTQARPIRCQISSICADLFMIELIRGNVYKSARVKFFQNPSSRFLVIANTSSTNQTSNYLFNMCRIYERNLTMIELIWGNIDNSALVTFGLKFCKVILESLRTQLCDGRKDGKTRRSQIPYIYVTVNTQIILFGNVYMFRN
jgi:hypothetical protein